MNRPLPSDWTTDCESCQWFLAVYNREDLHLFKGALWLTGQEHVMMNYGADEIPGANTAYWEKRFDNA